MVKYINQYLINHSATRMTTSRSSRYSFKVFLLLTSLCIAHAQLYEGDVCMDEHSKVEGRCKLSQNCEGLEEEFENKNIRPTICSFAFNDVLVCCKDIKLNVITQAPEITTEGNKRKRISEIKCEEYTRGVVDTGGQSPLLLPDWYNTREILCHYTGVEILVGGQTASPGEFPHMAAVGWPNLKEGGYTFLCGGFLISHHHVVTAAHCSYHRGSLLYKEPVVVRLGQPDFDNTGNKDSKPLQVAIKNVIVHPNYNTRKYYHDIAILELVSDVVFEPHIRPACLWTKDDFGGYDKAVATGWNVVDGSSEKTSRDIKKITLSLLGGEVCNVSIPPTRKWQGMDDTQICAGDVEGGKSTCQGDSGTPLQVTSKENPCIHYVMGSTSFGRACGLNTPTVYTRISYYLDWIESVVWPTQ